MNSRAGRRLAIALAVAFAAQLLVVGLFGLPLLADMDWEQRITTWGALAAMLLLALGLLLNWLQRAYSMPLLRLTEQLALMAANPAHRARAEGAAEVRRLTEQVNGLAQQHQLLRQEVQARVEHSASALSEERNRLAALMSELDSGVLVCNAEGRTLLYNSAALALLQDGHDGQPDASPIGLGRSVFGAIDRGLIIHALEQIQYRLERPDRQDAEAGRPVCRFVASLGRGRTVRAQMVPVLAEPATLVGFILTLEDITRSIESNGRRDALLQCLTHETRAALGNIRAAVEAMQLFPAMGPARRIAFTGIIDQESQRLARQIDRALREQGDQHEGEWRLEDMRGADLVALLQRRLAAPNLHIIGGDAIDSDLWLKVDSYALSQAMLFLARQLSDEAGVRELRLDLHRGASMASLDITWVASPVAPDTIGAWENVPLSLSAAGSELTLNTVVALHGGTAVYRAESSRSVSRYRLMLPVSENRNPIPSPTRHEERPAFYDFDLFHQAGQTVELDQTPLARLTCTVFDTETTGLRPTEGDEIVSVGAIRVVNGRLLQNETFDQLIKPRRPPGPESIAIHGITDAMLEGQPVVEAVLPRLYRFAEDSVLVAHNAAFDMRFLQLQQSRTGIAFTQPVLDTLLLSQVIHPYQEQHSLEAIAERLGVPMVGRHTALGDAIVTGEVFLKMIPLLAEKGICTLQQARAAAEQTLYARIRY